MSLLEPMDRLVDDAGKDWFIARVDKGDPGMPYLIQAVGDPQESFWLSRHLSDDRYESTPGYKVVSRFSGDKHELVEIIRGLLGCLRGVSVGAELLREAQKAVRNADLAKEEAKRAVLAKLTAEEKALLVLDQEI